jgi:hypothetical protein
MKFTSLLKNIIAEQSRFEVLFNALTKPSEDKNGAKVKPKLSKKEFIELVKADPTTKLNNIEIDTANSEQLAKVKAGAYVQWLIKNYLIPKTERQYGDNGYDKEVKQVKETFMEDLYKVTDDLKKFDRFKGRLPKELRDINKITPDQLYDAVKDFDLTLASTTKAERKDAKYAHPGGTFELETPNYVITKITRTDELGKEAACFYGGNNKETRWCTSAPGLSYFERYIKDGPLFQVYEKSSEPSKETGLPSTRWQFHFQSNQFMDKDDRSINLVEFLNKSDKEVKEYFKPQFMENMTKSSGKGGTSIDVEFPRSPAAQFIALYGFDEFFESLPDNITKMDFSGGNSGSEGFPLPKAIGRLQNLEGLHIDGLISDLPSEICNCKKLRYLSLPNNKNLKSIPDCLKDLPNLKLVNFKGCDNLKLPEDLKVKLSIWG